MAKQIILHDEKGNEYILEFSRNTVERMQRSGFVLDTDRLYMCGKDLITGAFQMHHRGMSWDKISEVWMRQNKRDALLAELAKMFNAPMLDLIGVDEQNSEQEENPTWTVLG